MNDLWKERLLLAASDGEYSEEMVSQVFRLGLNQEDLRDLCSSLCLNHWWMGGVTMGIGHWENRRFGDWMGDFGLIDHDTIMAKKREEVDEELLYQKQGRRVDVDIPEEQRTLSVMRCSREVGACGNALDH